jgi:hypothetical protein
MKTITRLVALLGVLTAGCAHGTDPATAGLYTRMGALDYARLICSGVDIEQYATCVNRMLDVYANPTEWEFPPEQATSGPFVVMLGADNYYGWYRSHPFAADFRVSNGRTICRGGYNAFAGPADAVFAVQCDDGRRGTASIVRDQGGRNGVGTLTMSDGSVGRIVFGRDALKGTPAAG